MITKEFTDEYGDSLEVGYTQNHDDKPHCAVMRVYIVKYNKTATAIVNLDTLKAIMAELETIKAHLEENQL